MCVEKRYRTWQKQKSEKTGQSESESEKRKTHLLRVTSEIHSRLDSSLDSGIQVCPAGKGGAIDGQRVARRVRDGNVDLAVFALRGDGRVGADLGREGGREGCEAGLLVVICGGCVCVRGGGEQGEAY